MIESRSLEKRFDQCEWISLPLETIHRGDQHESSWSHSTTTGPSTLRYRLKLTPKRPSSTARGPPTEAISSCMAAECLPALEHGQILAVSPMAVQAVRQVADRRSIASIEPTA